jgi:hypothetical protein
MELFKLILILVALVLGVAAIPYAKNKAYKQLYKYSLLEMIVLWVYIICDLLTEQ